ncbi:MAG: carbohydrate kinase family protein [Roseiflexaceae bacterium]
MRAGAIMAVGDLVWDVLAQPDSMLLPGGDTTGRIALAPGGSAANVAAWVARLGAPAAFVGAVGADVFGDLIVADLTREGVEGHIIRNQYDTGVIVVMIDRAGQRSMITNQGADFHLQPADLPVAAIARAAHVHITAWSLFTDPPRAAAIQAAKVAKAGGATVSFDPASYQMIREMGRDTFDAIVAELPIDIILPNRDEGMVLTGEREPAAIAHALRKRFRDAVVVLKLDKDGCYVSAHGYAQHHSTTEVAVVDATGAGDSFNAGFLAHYVRTGDIAGAAHLANNVGSWVGGRFGARPPLDAAFAPLLNK